MDGGRFLWVIVNGVVIFCTYLLTFKQLFCVTLLCKFTMSGEELFHAENMPTNEKRMIIDRPDIKPRRIFSKRGPRNAMKND